MAETILTERFDRALIFARQLHKDQFRKGTEIPYITHLLSVSALVLEDGGDEDQAIAGLLHDAAEDQGGYQTLNDIRQQFGKRVAHIVEGCSDTIEFPKPPWLERKESYIAHLRTAEIDIWRVSLADKLHNARTILMDLRQNGDTTWMRFSGGKDGALWYYQTLSEVFQEKYDSPMVAELTRLVDEINRLAAD